MSSIATEEVARRGLPPILRVFALRAALAVPLVALGDYLSRVEAGTSLLLFILGVALAAALTNGWRFAPRTIALAGVALALGGLPLIEHAGILPLAFAAAGLAIFALLLTGQGSPGWTRKPFDALLLWLSGPRRLFWDALVVLEALAGTGWGRSIFGTKQLLGWVVPLGLLGVFALLFADANPLVLRGLVALDPGTWLPAISFRMVMTWTILLLLVWPFLHVRLMPGAWEKAATMFSSGGATPPRTRGLQGPDAPVGYSVVPAIQEAPPVPLRDLLLGREAIARSLVLFNLLFAVQTGLDAIYLWGGASLPEGTTYASYAHRGAYPLIATALLAAGFVLAAMRPGGPAESSPFLRGLVYLFVAQNVGLVLSSILRLDLYVSVYSLSYWRVAAFIWMGLVALGLVLIAMRIALRQSNRWLVSANAIAATATLYACCFVNFAALIANYNVAHQPEAARRLDVEYLVSLGPDAIPAIDRLIPTVSASAPGPQYYAPTGTRREWLIRRREILASHHASEMSDWRRWTLRGWRLSAYLAVHPTPRPDVAPASPPDVPAPAPVEPAPSPR